MNEAVVLHTLHYQTLPTSVVHRSSRSERRWTVDSGGKERERERKREYFE